MPKVDETAGTKLSTFGIVASGEGGRGGAGSADLAVIDAPRATPHIQRKKRHPLNRQHFPTAFTKLQT